MPGSTGLPLRERRILRLLPDIVGPLLPASVALAAAASGAASGAEAMAAAATTVPEAAESQTHMRVLMHGTDELQQYSRHYQQQHSADTGLP